MTQVSPLIQRRNIVVRGIVQGVGFCPIVYNLTAGLELAGFVRSDSDRLPGSTPSLARIASETAQPVHPTGNSKLYILTSPAGVPRDVLIPPSAPAVLLEQEQRS